ANNVWVVGANKIVMQCGSPTCSVVNSGTNDLRDVWADSGGGAWAVGSGEELVLRCQGKSCRGSGPNPITLTRVWGSDANNVWAVGMGNTMMHCGDGQAPNFTPICNAVTVPAAAMLTSVWGSDPNNFWAVGATGAVVKCAGMTCATATVAPAVPTT